MITYFKAARTLCIGLIIGCIISLVWNPERAYAQNAAAEHTPQEWTDRIATTIAIGYFAVKCPAVYPSVFYSPVKPSAIISAIQAEADDAATDQGLPAGWFYDEVRAAMASLDPKWNSLEEYERRVACGNVAVSYPGLLKRVPTV
jgi:hypothetical protein